MKPRRHLLRDVFVFSLPLVALLVYLVMALCVSFYNGEIEGFHGYPVRGMRVGGIKAVIQEGLAPIYSRTSRRYIARVARRDRPDPPLRQFDLHVDGRVLDRLASALPASGREWEPGQLVEGQEWVSVEVHYRGQQMSNYYWPRKAWKIKTARERLVDGYRVINLSPAMNRMEAHLTFLIAEQAGLAAPRSRVVQLFLNLKDQGLYLQEEQIDESMIRRIGRMPGDIFYGELLFPGEPKMSSDDLFWNPYVWRKKGRNNNFSEEHRPHLTELLDHICSESPESFDALYRLLDMEQFARYFAVVSFQGDLHVDDTHNHKLYFNPLSGRFEAILWNSRMGLADSEGVETMANRFYYKLTRDPRFLDRVQRILYEDLYLAEATAAQLTELDRIEATYTPFALDRGAFVRYLDSLRFKVEQRGRAVERFLQEGEVRFVQNPAGSGALLQIFARAASSLRLDHIELEGPATGVRLFEDRDFDGSLSDGDREVRVRADGQRLVIVEDGLLLHVGRDFRAPYAADVKADTFQASRDYTRLAFLESPFLLVSADEGGMPSVIGLAVERTVGDSVVKVSRARPESHVATQTIHPWKFRAPPVPESYRLSGTVEITEDLVVGERDSLRVDPGTKLLLGPGVSLIIESQVHLDGIQIDRLVPERPWGVLALQGAATSGSTIENCTISGGSEDTIRHIYYSGMLSVHHADHVTVRNCVVSDNVLGDDSVRFAAAKDLEISEVRVVGANGDAIDCDVSEGVISDTVILGPRNDGVDLMTSRVVLQRLEIRGAGDKGISFGERAESEGIDVSIQDSTTGIAIKDQSTPNLADVTIENCVVGVDGFDKNWRYPGGGRGRLAGCRLTGNDIDVRLDSSSQLVLQDCSTEARFEIAGGIDSGRLVLTADADGEVAP